MLKIRRSHDRLIFNMGIPIPGKDGLYIEMGPWLSTNMVLIMKVRTGSCHPWDRIVFTCYNLLIRNDRKGRYIFVFPKELDKLRLCQHLKSPLSLTVSSASRSDSGCVSYQGILLTPVPFIPWESGLPFPGYNLTLKIQDQRSRSNVPLSAQHPVDSFP